MEDIGNRVIHIRFSGIEETADMDIFIYLIPMYIISVKPYFILGTLLISCIQKKRECLKRTAICIILICQDVNPTIVKPKFYTSIAKCTTDVKTSENRHR